MLFLFCYTALSIGSCQRFNKSFLSDLFLTVDANNDGYLSFDEAKGYYASKVIYIYFDIY